MNANEVNAQVTGLCMTCNHVSSCVYLANATSSVWSCEEFDDRPTVTDEPATDLSEQAGIVNVSEPETPLRKAS
jgi:hypothetical protein